VPLLSPAATTRRRTHALVFNFASVGREALLDGRFAPQAVIPQSFIARRPFLNPPTERAKSQAIVGWRRKSQE
jgi:hypothetical protein